MTLNQVYHSLRVVDPEVFGQNLLARGFAKSQAVIRVGGEPLQAARQAVRPKLKALDPPKRFGAHAPIGHGGAGRRGQAGAMQGIEEV